MLLKKLPKNKIAPAILKKCQFFFIFLKKVVKDFLKNFVINI